MSIMKPPFHTELNLGHRLSQGIVGCWLFNEAPPPLGSAMDLSGNGNHGTLVADTHSVPGLYGPALDFAVNDYVDYSTFTKLNNVQWTVIVSLSVDSAAFNLTTYVLSIINTSQFNERLRLYKLDNERLGIIDDNGLSIFPGAANVVSDTWYTFAITYNFDTQRAVLYQDGVIIGTDTSFTQAANTAVIMRLGQRAWTVGSGWQGQISDVTIWNRALSAGDIKELYRDPFQMFKRNL